MWRLVFILFCLAIPSHACLNDMDSLATEAKGLPGTLEVISGRFERNPPLFYQMRLARVTKEIAAQPTKLNLYDDAGVACDRLHRDDEAIAWMKQKRAQMKPFPQDKEHWYRYHANLGTFQAHNWLRNGANRKNIGEMKTARNNIKRAIQIKPDAHFGREKYQLMAMEWIINPPKPEMNDHKVTDFNSFINWGNFKRADAPAVIKGLSGLITLGDAWESVDVFDSLAFVLGQRMDTTLAYSAKLRYQELIKKGKNSLYPYAPKGNDLLNLLDSKNEYGSLTDNYETVIEADYIKRRQEAESYNQSRINFMMRKLKAGLHPDKNSDFWNGWQNPAAPELPGDTTLDHWLSDHIWVVIVFWVFVLFVLPPLVIFFLWRKWKAYQKARLAS